MIGIMRSERVLSDNTRIRTYHNEIVGCNVIEVEAGTTGLHGGDTGHGCRTYFRIEDVSGTDISVKVLGSKTNARGIEVITGGDSELETMIDALEFIVKVLRSQRKPGESKHE